MRDQVTSARCAALRSSAAEAVRCGDLERAIITLRQLLSEAGPRAEDALLLGDCLWADYRFDDALAVYARCAEAAPLGERRHALLLAARKLFSLGRFDPSAALIGKALADSPRDAELMRMLAELRERQGRAPEGESLAREALKIAPGDPRCVRALALMLRRLGRVEEAVSLLRVHLPRCPEPDAWRLQSELATALDARGDYDGAMRAICTAHDALRPRVEPARRKWHLDMTRREALADSVTRIELERWRNEIPRERPARRIVLLAGHPRSGTTLLETRLAACPGVLCTDETGVLRNEFIRPITLDPASPGEVLEELRSFDAGQLADGRAFYLRATEAHLGETIGSSLLVEKDPFLTQDLLFPLRLLPEASILMPLRDPRDVAISFFFTILPLGGDSASTLDLSSAVESVALSLRLWRRWREILPQPWHEVRYESLVTSPEDTLRSLQHFLGLETALSAGPPAAPDRGVRTPSYAAVARPMHRGAIGRWRHYAPWLEPVLAPLEPLLEEFGAAG